MADFCRAHTYKVSDKDQDENISRSKDGPQQRWMTAVFENKGCRGGFQEKKGGKRNVAFSMGKPCQPYMPYPAPVANPSIRQQTEDTLYFRSRGRRSKHHSRNNPPHPPPGLFF